MNARVFPVANGPDIQFRAPLAGYAPRVAAAFEAWHNAGDDDRDELHERYVAVLQIYAGIDFK